MKTMKRRIPGPTRLRPDEELIERSGLNLGQLYAIAEATGNRAIMGVLRAMTREHRHRRERLPG